MPATALMADDIAATVPVSVTLGPASATPVVALNAKYLPFLESFVGNVIEAKSSESGNVNALSLAFSTCCITAYILSNSVLSDDILNGPDVAKSDVLSIGTSLNIV